jgi:hypothetical protein
MKFVERVLCVASKLSLIEKKCHLAHREEHFTLCKLFEATQKPYSYHCLTTTDSLNTCPFNSKEEGQFHLQSLLIQLYGSYGGT